MSGIPSQSNEGSRRRKVAAGRGNVGIQLAFWHFLLRSHASHCLGSWFSECNTLPLQLALTYSYVTYVYLHYFAGFPLGLFTWLNTGFLMPDTLFWDFCVANFVIPKPLSVRCSGVKIWFRFLQSLCKVSVVWQTFYKDRYFLFSGSISVVLLVCICWFCCSSYAEKP